MNYHLMIDDKFIDDFIEDTLCIETKSKNKFYVRGDKDYPKHVKSKLVIWTDLKNIDLLRDLNNATEQDKIIVHWYDLEIGSLILKEVKMNVPLYVALWGGDFYEDPYLYHINWIHDKLTLDFVLKNNIVPGKYSRRPHLFFKKIWILFNYKKQALSEFENKKNTVKRIDKILLSENSEAEIDLVKQIYSLKNVEYMCFSYDLNVDLTTKIIKKDYLLNNKINVQIGNSATESNNHLDAFSVIERFSRENIQIYLPLSYGNIKYSNFIKNKGSIIFGDKIEYAEKFIPREDYINKLNQIDICIMYHNRQQGFGNCIPLLTLGKKLYIKKRNPLYSFFIKSGIVIFDAEEISKISFEEFILPLSEEQKINNSTKLTKLFSKEQRLNNLKKVLD